MSYKFVVNKAKGESQNGGNKKTKYAKFFEKNEHFLPPDAQNVRFSENLVCFGLLLPFRDLFFCHFTDKFINSLFSRASRPAFRDNERNSDPSQRFPWSYDRNEVNTSYISC